MAKGMRRLKSILKKLHYSPSKPPSQNSQEEQQGEDLHPVYVGKSRRRYLVDRRLLDHPLLRSLVHDEEEEGIVVAGCEVVLFEHLLWMLENADDPHLPLDDLTDFYTC